MENELAKLCDVSLRTIQLDSKEINNQLREYNVEINSIVKKRYYLSGICKNIPDKQHNKACFEL